ncbi:MAG: PaaI family thioesterase [Rhodocyclaceae bacterium]|nr:PaaI family thioesterase [Rhodocyclaceae bacterium]MBX3669759.1 PaaI family thioesterase [Rhodocyclaceae bacterium]
MSDANKYARLRPDMTPASMTERGAGYLPGLLGIEIIDIAQGVLRSHLTVQKHHMAPNGFLHAATVVALADATAGYGTMAHLPAGAQSFTTIELKTNYLTSTDEGVVVCTARLEHGGRTTQVWDAVVSALQPDRSERRMALFRCTQMILWPRA